MTAVADDAAVVVIVGDDARSIWMTDHDDFKSMPSMLLRRQIPDQSWMTSNDRTGMMGPRPRRPPAVRTQGQLSPTVAL